MRGMLRLLDDQIRRFVTYLKETGIYERSLIVFLSDHRGYGGRIR